MQANASAFPDYQKCSTEQLKVLNSVKDFYSRKSKELLSLSILNKGSDKRSIEIKQHLFKLANESFIKQMALEKVSETFSDKTLMTTSLASFKTAFEDSMKTKLLISDAVEGFRGWSSANGLNSRAFSSLSTHLREEVIERAFKTFGGKVIEQLSEEESFILGITSEIGLNAAFYYGGRLVTSQVIGKLSLGTVASWAGGPTGIVVMLAPLFMSGTVPPENKWTDFLHDYPRLIMDPAQLVNAKLAKDPKEAMYYHCLAWERRPKSMESVQKKLLKELEEDIRISVRRIKVGHQMEDDMKSRYFLEMKIDKTYVKKPRI